MSLMTTERMISEDEKPQSTDEFTVLEAVQQWVEFKSPLSRLGLRWGAGLGVGTYLCGLALARKHPRLEIQKSFLEKA